MTVTEQGQFVEPTWAIVELMGRNVIAGQISEVAVAGSAMLRVDVPAIKGVEAYTKFFGGQAIYAITPTDEASALHAAEHFQQAPVSQWVVPYRELPSGEETGVQSPFDRPEGPTDHLE